VLSLTTHVFVGTSAENEERALAALPAITIAGFLFSAKFWSVTLQTWQAEYLAIRSYIVLSIFLRQEGSAESKPVGASNETTGKVNE
jgi:Domain of unknown function (DUF6766)